MKSVRIENGVPQAQEGIEFGVFHDGKVRYELHIPDGFTGQWLLIPDGEKVEGAVGRLIDEAERAFATIGKWADMRCPAEEWRGVVAAARAEFALRGEERIDQGLIAALVRAGESMRDECWDAVKAWRNAALGEPARDDTHRVQMREGAYEQEEIAASVVHVTWQDVKDRAENAIREIPDAPKKAKVPTAVFYRRPTLPGHEHTFPYLCSCCGEGTRGMNGVCGHCGIEGVVRNLPEGDDA